MTSVAILSIILSLGLGLVLKYLWDNEVFSISSGRQRISWSEFALAAACIMLVVTPFITVVGTNLARADLLSYNEYWNGYELDAVVSSRTCSRDGDCRYEYRCDPYTVTRTRVVTDSKGNSHTETYTETEYHDCPYGTLEHSYRVKTTLGVYDMGTTLDQNPVAWRASEGIPGNIPRGTPVAWAEAKARLDAQDPGPVTKVETYDNYILAAQNTILREWSDEIEPLKQQGLLPDVALQKDLVNYYRSSKVDVMGGLQVDQAAWNDALERFNAALGTDLQGDLHIVMVPSSVDQYKYEGALQAYWSGETFGDNAISKNAIVVIFGLEGQEIKWTQAFTGMPLGNEMMLNSLEALRGIPADPTIVLGKPVGIIESGDVDTIRHTDGAIEGIIWGTTPFERICMTCDDPGENGGYGYLIGDIEPSGWHKFLTGLVILLVAAGVWVATIYSNLLDKETK